MGKKKPFCVAGNTFLLKVRVHLNLRNLPAPQKPKELLVHDARHQSKRRASYYLLLLIIIHNTVLITDIDEDNNKLDCQYTEQ
jgi:hypothetical protein